MTRGDPVGLEGCRTPGAGAVPAGLVQEGPGGDGPHKLASDNPQPTHLLKDSAASYSQDSLSRGQATWAHLTVEELEGTPAPFALLTAQPGCRSTLSHRADAVRYHHLSSAVYPAPTVTPSRH